MNITALPQELQLHLFSFMDEKTLSRASQVCSHFKSLASDAFLEYPRISSTVHQNLLEGRYFRTVIPLEQPLDNQFYLRLVDGKPTLSSYIKLGFGSQVSTDIDARTHIDKHVYQANLTKTITVGSTKYRNYLNTLHVNNVLSIYSVKDIACLNGSLIYSTSNGLYRLKKEIKDDPWSNKNGHKISSHVYTQIICDEKKGIIFGLTENGIESLDFNHKDAAHEVPIEPVRSMGYRIANIVFNLFSNIAEGISDVNSNTWKIHAVSAIGVFAFGIAIGLSAGLILAESLTVGLALFIIWEVMINTFLIGIGFAYGIIKTAIDTIEEVHA